MQEYASRFRLKESVEDQGFKPNRGLTLLPPSRGVVLWLDHAGDSVHKITKFIFFDNRFDFSRFVIIIFVVSKLKILKLL